MTTSNPELPELGRRRNEGRRSCDHQRQTEAVCRREQGPERHG